MKFGINTGKHRGGGLPAVVWFGRDDMINEHWENGHRLIQGRMVEEEEEEEEEDVDTF